MIVKLTENSKQIIHYEADDFIKDFNFLKERLFSVYKFIRKRHFPYSSMILEKEKTTSHKEYKKMPNELKKYINRFYDIAIKRFCKNKIDSSLL